MQGGIFSSCQKNEQPEIVETYTTNCDNPNLSKEIKSFRDNMIGTHKSISSMQLNDAVWMMEATTTSSQITIYCTNATVNTQKALNKNFAGAYAPVFTTIIKHT